MSIITFAPSTKIKSADENANWQNFSNHGRNFTVKIPVPGILQVLTSKDYFSLPDNGIFSRVDLVIDTAPTGANLIVDIESSTDLSSWTTIFTGGTNRPIIVAGAKTGNTTTIDVPTVTKLTTYYRIKISQVGSTIAGADLNILIRGTYTLD